ncbi:aldehyde dehydrogenase family protein [Azospirillum sp. RWY-5-1]|uniref:Aldehyde dehydrogenase family protein n=1 Tax=Azospirillum oleiclasticum TaxID=2735135 RepID=A0ABX2TAN1_9PROT|nr:aldehyde dehydrogenase family protein [Azospirillum oleiclasticum]NYZ13254.1 aldehyde dehydrogenase family protein [Azospirillum oleiclasticum]NYZ20074.1 aldehyde dehydrogenase family protein [Azospirillum oleiclasticum]
MDTITKTERPQTPEQALVAEYVARARKAQAAFAYADQETTDMAVRAVAWSLYKPEHARMLAELAVEDTGIGNVPDKVTKNTRKTFGTLRDLLRAKSVGIIEEDKAKGLVKYAKPVGVVAAITPSTNPAATPINKAMMAIKGRNAIIMASSPSGLKTTCKTVELARQALEALGLPPDLIQALPKASKPMTDALMKSVDLIVATGSQANVRAAYSSGTPAIGVGAGNVPVIIDDSADFKDAAEKITASKIFDNSTSCSSENSVTILDGVYDEAMAALKAAGGYLCTPEERQRVLSLLWVDGKLNRDLIAHDAKVLAEAFQLAPEAHSAKFFMVEEDGVGYDHPFSGEKLSLVLAVYRAKDYPAAKEQIRKILDFQGRGHSCGIHTKNMDHARDLAEDLEVVRVLVNQAHTFGNGGGFNSGLNFTLSMGCGTWGKNSITENLSLKNFLNITHLVTVIPEDKPSEEELFGPLWAKVGK